MTKRKRNDYKDIKPGQSFGKLTTIKELDPAIRKRGFGFQKETVWLFQCDCGDQKAIKLSDVLSGHRKSCGCLQPFIKGKPPGKLRINNAEQNLLFLQRRIWNNHYKDGCSLEDFIRISQLPCHYCGTVKSNTWKFRDAEYTYNGLDRLDNSKNHSIDNVVPCCWTCNRMRGVMSIAEFLEHISKIYNHNR